MKRYIPILACLLLPSCATTIVREKGQVVLAIQANAKRVHYQSPAGSVLDIDELNHSTATRAGGSVIGTIGSSIMGMMVTGAAGGLVR